MQRYPNTYSILAGFYPPKPPPQEGQQLALF
jgi:hypothetical protein